MAGKVFWRTMGGFFLVCGFLLSGCTGDSSENPELYCNSETNRIDLVEVKPGEITIEISALAGTFYTYDTGSPVAHVLDPVQYAVNDAAGVIEAKASVGELEIGGSYPSDPVSLVHYYHTSTDSFLEPLGTYWVEF